MAKQDELRINHQIRAREVFVIGSDNEKKGIMSFMDALAQAENEGLDLVEISPGANPPVCRIIDYGKYRYQQEKRMKENKKIQAQNRVELHEIRMQPKIDSHDLEVKTKAIAEFLNGNDKCKVTIRFHGRELAHTELGKEVLDKILEMLKEKEVSFNLDQGALMEGRNMSMMLSPVRKKG